MIFVRLIPTLQLAFNSGKGVVQAVRNSHVASYRVAPPPHSRATKIGAELVGGAMWWWVLWHLWHEHEHITGEFPYPNTAAWSNKELGIPPDNE